MAKEKKKLSENFVKNSIIKWSSSTPKIIAAWPATGKSYLGNRYKNVLDAQSSYYHYEINNHLDRVEFEKTKISKERTINPDWPNNYIAHLKKNISKYDIILVPPIPLILDYLYDNNIEFVLVLPNPGCKKEYIKRFQERGNSESYINYLSEMWEEGFKLMDKYNVKKIELKENQYLENAIKLLNLKLLIKEKKIKIKFPARLEGNTLYPSYSIKNGKLGGGYGFSVSMENYLIFENQKEVKDIVITSNKNAKLLIHHFIKIFKNKFNVKDQGITVKLYLDPSFKNHSGLAFNINIICALAYCFRNSFSSEMKDKELINYLYSVNTEIENNHINYNEIFTGIGHNCAFSGGICFVNKLGSLIYNYKMPNDYKAILIQTDYKRKNLSTEEIAKSCLDESLISEEKNVEIIFSIVKSLKQGGLSTLEKNNLYLQLHYVLRTYIKSYINYESLIALLLDFDKYKKSIVGITYSKPNIYIITNEISKTIKKLKNNDFKYKVFDMCNHGIQEIKNSEDSN